MAEGEGSHEPQVPSTPLRRNGGPMDPGTTSVAAGLDGEGAEMDKGDEDEEEEEEEEEEEPRLKYSNVTKKLTALFRAGDAVSSFLVAGDKMIVGTHNGNIHALSLPSFQSLRVYHAHSASVSAISISPFPPPLSTATSEAATRATTESQSGVARESSGSGGPKQRPKPAAIPATPSNLIYIATAAIDGNVCISSLVDPKDVQLRNFSRPVQAVSLSPEYKHDRNYLSGGQAGSLVLTSGGPAGKSANAHLGGATGAAQGWLGAVGWGSNNGSDRVLHSGEGPISTINWSLSGKYVLWVNEQGIKIMRSNLRLENGDSGLEWKRLGHIDRPNRPGWDDMATVWKARVEWIDRENLESDDEPRSNMVLANGKPSISARKRFEEVVVGWGGTVWLIRVHCDSNAIGANPGEQKSGRIEVTNILRIDCTISGISLYSQDLLVVLAYTEPDVSPSANPKSETSKKKGRHQRQDALEPELRLIDVNTKEEVSADTLTISRYESLSAVDYHLGILPPMKIPATINQRGALVAISSGLETIGQGVWDMSIYPGRFFSSKGSTGSSRSNDDKGNISKASDRSSGEVAALRRQAQDASNVAISSGMKIFMFSPYDCVVAVKRDLVDRLKWLDQIGHYQTAWELLEQHPEAAEPTTESSEESLSSKAPSLVAGQTKNADSLAEFLADSASASSQPKKNVNSVAEKEKRRIGELWLEQLVSKNDWTTAGEVAGKVLSTFSRWEHWTWIFIRNNKFDEISPHVPPFEGSPPLPSHLYEIILDHYVSSNPGRFKELVDFWPPTLFDASSIVSTIEDRLRDPIAVPKESSDWRTLQECLAKLLLADGLPSDALRCYIRLQDADTALTLISTHHLLSTIADDIPGLILIRVSSSQLKHASTNELEDLASEPISLLVDGAHHGTVESQEVVDQLERASLPLFLFFYLRALWLGKGATSSTEPRANHKVGHLATASALAADEGKLLVDQFADTAVSLFADYDRPLLMDFLQTSTAYTFDTAVTICEKKSYISELVYLLAKTGQMKKALFLILDELKDVVEAINFAKRQDDADLWDDLLDYSMSRPKFIQGLLAEVGTAIDPIKLVRRIPSGLEVEGLRDGLKKMVREYDLQDSISQGVAKVLQGEVAVGMEALRKGRMRGIKFNVEAGGKKTRSRDQRPSAAKGDEQPSPDVDDALKPGRCAGCGVAFGQYEPQPLIGFACGHIYHFPHLLQDPDPDPDPNDEDDHHHHHQHNLESTHPDNDVDDNIFSSAPFTRSVNAKVTNARLLKMRVDELGGCRLCIDRTKRKT